MTNMEHMIDELQPTSVRPIKPPMWSGTVDIQKMTLTITRDDENGKLTYEDIKRLGFGK